MIRAILFSLAVFFRRDRTLVPVALSNAPVGSSHSKILGFFTSALAIESLCSSPPERFDGKSDFLLVKPTASITSSTSRGFLLSFAAIATFSLAVNEGIRL